MNCQKTAFYLTALAIILSTFQTSSAQVVYRVEINAIKKQVKYGDPIFVNLKLRFETPRVSKETGKPSPYIRCDGLAFQVQHRSEDEASMLPFRMLPRFKLHDRKGLEYTTNVKIFCDLYQEKKKLIKKIIFDKPGAYTLTIFGAKRQGSNTLDILVEPSSLGEKALSLLADPKDFAFLMGGIYKSPERISHLQQVVRQCKGTLLAKWCAARLGLEYFKEFQKKHTSLEKFKAKHEQGQIQEPLFDQAHKYLSAGYELPDEFPIRDSVLGHLAETKFVDGNYKKAISLVDELRAKYPHGEYGRKARGWKEDLVELQEGELAQTSQPQVRSRRHVLPVLLVVAAGISLIGYLLLLRKKAISRSK